MRKYVLLFLLMMVYTVTASYAATSYEDYAVKLKEIGVFKGSDSGFELDRAPTRVEAAVMFVRLLGVEKEAQEKKYEHPFTDVPDWASDYVGYLYHEKLTNGTSDTTFGGNDNIQAKSYMTFILRSLGYKDSEGEFSWDKSLDFAKQKEIIDNLVYDELTTKTFLRGHVAKLSYDAMLTTLKNGEKTLIDKLIDSNVIDKAAKEQIRLGEPTPEEVQANVNEATILTLDEIILHNFNIETIIKSEDKYTAYAYGGKVFSSYDGTVWTEVGEVDTFMGKAHAATNGESYIVTSALIGKNDYYHGSNLNNFDINDNIYELSLSFSKDGMNYEKISGAAEYNNRLLHTEGKQYQVFWDGEKYIIIFLTSSSQPFNLCSSDGKNFYKKAVSYRDPNGLAPKGLNLSETYLDKVIFEGKLFLAMSDHYHYGKMVWKSKDGIHWDMVWFSKDFLNIVFDITYGSDGSYYIILNDILYSSNNGDKWVIKKSKLVDEIMKNNDDVYQLYGKQNMYNKMNIFYCDDYYFIQLEGQNKIYITEDMNNYYSLKFDFDIGNMLLADNNIVVTDKIVIDVKKMIDKATKEPIFSSDLQKPYDEKLTLVKPTTELTDEIISRLQGYDYLIKPEYKFESSVGTYPYYEEFMNNLYPFKDNETFYTSHKLIYLTDNITIYRDGHRTSFPHFIIRGLLQVKLEDGTITEQDVEYEVRISMAFVKDDVVDVYKIMQMRELSNKKVISN